MYLVAESPLTPSILPVSDCVSERPPESAAPLKQRALQRPIAVALLEKHLAWLPTFPKVCPR